MKFFLICVFSLIIVSIFGTDAMNYLDDYNRMYNNTSQKSKVSGVSTAALSAGEMMDEAKIRNVALCRDYIAQYLLAQQAGEKSRSAYNGEKEALLKEKAVLLSISAIRGGDWESLDEINGIAQPS